MKRQTMDLTVAGAVLALALWGIFLTPSRASQGAVTLAMVILGFLALGMNLATLVWPRDADRGLAFVAVVVVLVSGAAAALHYILGAWG